MQTLVHAGALLDEQRPYAVQHDLRQQEGSAVNLPDRNAPVDQEHLENVRQLPGRLAVFIEHHAQILAESFEQWPQLLR